MEAILLKMAEQTRMWPLESIQRDMIFIQKDQAADF
jgi:hypothetical protein